PGYDEVVQWFVLREPIPVPPPPAPLYLEQLRDIQDAQGKKITCNCRELQNPHHNELLILSNNL
ncbi:MAG: hypothetical protein MJE68_11285, partial [Proteobacteria bacterium]|nr:hypothetical protein [Pseudomonadota bacterium]